jgi:hypothetical protein
MAGVIDANGTDCIMAVMSGIGMQLAIMLVPAIALTPVLPFALRHFFLARQPLRTAFLGQHIFPRKTMTMRILLGTFPDQKVIKPLRHELSGNGARIGEIFQGGYCSNRQVRAIHECGIQLHDASRIG